MLSLDKKVFKIPKTSLKVGLGTVFASQYTQKQQSLQAKMSKMYSITGGIFSLVIVFEIVISGILFFCRRWILEKPPMQKSAYKKKRKKKKKKSAQLSVVSDDSMDIESHEDFQKENIFKFDEQVESENSYSFTNSAKRSRPKSNFPSIDKGE